MRQESKRVERVQEGRAAHRLACSTSWGTLYDNPRCPGGAAVMHNPSRG